MLLALSILLIALCSQLFPRLFLGAHMKTLLLLSSVLFTSFTIFAQSVPVTFRVNMRVKILEHSFMPQSGDWVRIVASFNNWGTSIDTLVHETAPNDSIYRITKPFPVGDTLTYKFAKSIRSGESVETVSRGYRVPLGGGTVPLVWFNNDSVASLGNVTFRVNMKVKMLEGSFRPDSGDYVRVAGSFNDWGNSRDTLTDVAPIDSIYQKTVSIATGPIEYKFLKTMRGGIDWGSGANRTYTVVAGINDLPVALFDNDSIVNSTVSGTMLFRVEMRAMQNIGWFLPPTILFRFAGRSTTGKVPRWL